MIRSAREMKGAAIEARDGPIGVVHDIYFDDQFWKLRYFVVDTGKWLPGRRVLIPPETIARTWKGEHNLPIELRRSRSKPALISIRPSLCPEQRKNSYIRTMDGYPIGLGA